jgi:hypothetical protein
VAGNPESHLERTLSEPDSLESSEILFLRADSLAMALRGLAATNEPAIGHDEYNERQTAAAVIITDTKMFFDDLKASDFRCMYHAGTAPVNAHLLRRLGSERALFESALVEPERWFELDYAEFHSVPQGAPQDLPHGMAGYQQLYVGSTRSQLAFSVHQLSMSFLNGGSWELGHRPQL